MRSTLAMQPQPRQMVVGSTLEPGGDAVEHQFDLGYAENAERRFDLGEE